MISFENDYSEGACTEILKALVKENFSQNTGYCLDKHCLNAEKLIKNRINRQDVDVHFITGGTPCNVLAMELLKPYEAIICVESGHINVHETGAIEHRGHKILTSKGHEGKLLPLEIEQIVLKHTDEHMVKPKLVFISQPTELGTVYSEDELIQIKDTCTKYGLYLYIDGARLGSGLASIDMDIKEIPDYADMFYIGGTKNGCLLGEAFVIVNEKLKKDFRFAIKQNSSLLAKGFVVGIEFETLFTNDLYFELAKHANEMANKLRNIFELYGIGEYVKSKTNQVFVVLDDYLLEKIQKEFVVSPWGKYSQNQTIVRFVTSWNTSMEQINEFKKYLDTVIA